MSPSPHVEVIMRTLFREEKPDGSNPSISITSVLKPSLSDIFFVRAANSSAFPVWEPKKIDKRGFPLTEDIGYSLLSG